MSWLRRESKKTACACKDILDGREGFWATYFSHRAEPILTSEGEIDKQAMEKKAGKTLAALCRFLDQNFAAFKECACPAAMILNEIYRLPVIQYSNPRNPVSWEEFRPFADILRKSKFTSDESESKEDKVIECTCQALWDAIIAIWDKRTPEGLLAREAAKEIDAFYEAVVSCDIAIAIRDLLEKHFIEFSQCPCQTAKHIRMIWTLPAPAIQEIDYSKRVPVSLGAAKSWNEKFQQLQKIITRGGEDMAEMEKTTTTAKCPCGCECEVEVKEGEEAQCPCGEDCKCAPEPEKAGCSCPCCKPSS